MESGLALPPAGVAVVLAAPGYWQFQGCTCAALAGGAQALPQPPQLLLAAAAASSAATAGAAEASRRLVATCVTQQDPGAQVSENEAAG